jgi:ATP-dependent Lhr-like helicase
VLREAAGAEGLPGGFGYVYAVYRAMEEQGRLRRGYFVAGRGATQFALPGAEERLRAGPRGAADRDREGDEDDDEDGDSSTPPLVLAATDPANPWGALLPWPEAHGRTPQRAPGARVILVEGRLLAWISRGAHHVTTFLSAEEPAASHDREALARTLVDLTRGPGGRSSMIATIDAAGATESPLAQVLVEHGFASRQGALVLIRSSGEGAALGRRRWAAAEADVGIDFDFADQEA